jgi:L-threonate 2-dehydrogenase
MPYRLATQSKTRGSMAAKNKGAVGIIGLGIMGGAFAQNLVASGWRVVGYDIDAARCRAMARAGVEIAEDAGDVAHRVSTIITSLPSPKALAATVAAIVKAKVPRRVLVEASTFTIEDKTAAEKALRKAGHLMLDCPMSGTGAQAKVRDLVVYASGGSAEIKKLKPMFAGFTRAVHDVGAFGNGSRMKYVANLLVAIHNVASAEAMVLGIKAGLPPQVIFDLIKTGAGNSRIFELRAPMMVKDDYASNVTMKISVWQKDMDVIGGYARKIRVPTPMFDASNKIYAKARKSGYDDQDTAAVCAVLEKMAGVKRRKR